MRFIREMLGQESSQTTLAIPEGSQFVGAISGGAMGIMLAFWTDPSAPLQARKFVRVAPGVVQAPEAKDWIPLAVVDHYGYTVGIFEIPGTHILPDTMRRHTQQGSTVDTIRERWNA